MRLIQRVGDFDGEFQCLIERNRPSIEALRKRFALKVFHYQEVDTILAADVEERADMRMVQRGDCPRLALETLAQLGPIGEMCRQHLDRDGAIQTCVVRTIHLSHTASSDHCQDLVGPEFHAGLKSHGQDGFIPSRIAGGIIVGRELKVESSSQAECNQKCESTSGTRLLG